jgi:hypothetical protein
MEQEKKNDPYVWVKRLGIAGFLFFLVKGLVWLAVFFFAGSSLLQSC